MGTEVNIEIWEDADRQSPVAEFLDNIPKSDSVRITKKLERCEERTFQEFFAQGDSFIEKINTNTDTTLYEVKFKGKGAYNYRAIGFRHGADFVILTLFHGSGSKGVVHRHVPSALERARVWESTHPMSWSRTET